MCSIERLFARMFVRLTCCVSCGIARARSFVCDHVRARRGRRGHVVAVAVPWRGRRALDVVTPLGVAVVTWPCRAVAVASLTSWPWRPPYLCRRRVVATRR